MSTNSPGNDSKAGPLRYTKNHVYNTADSLGKGATATVYLGRHQQTGEQAAIKVFLDNESTSRHITQARNREIELLGSLSHRNVMRILACEEEVISRNVVIIMPYCQEGSVQTLLDQPQHGFGFKEKEFLRFLNDITNGLEYLKSAAIIHRDIKPGNILKRIEDDGSSVYILTDFGAARRLDEEETFMSIYGTEEYIHPNMFQRAVLRQPGQKQFTASVDLWSLAITIFHVATGKLPFRALGGRNDSEMMYKIISERQSGDISGVQRQQDGQVERSKRIPDTCYLSSGLKTLLEPMLAGIFEIDQSAAWTFERYFEAVNSIISMKTLDVFCAQNGSNIKLYLRKTDCYRDIQEKIASLTDIPADRQLVLLSQSELQNVVETNEQIQTFPKSVQKSQLFLFEKDNYDCGKLICTNLPPFPAFSVDSSLSNDCTVAKQCAAISCFAEWKTAEILKNQQLVHDAKMNLRLFVQSSLAPLGKMAPELEKMLELSKKRLSSVRTSQTNIKNFKGILDLLSSSQTFRKFSKMVDIFCKDDSLIDDTINRMNVRIEEINVYLSVLIQRLNELSTTNPADHLGCHEDDHCLSKMEHVRVGVQTVMTTFSKHKKYGSLHPHEKFIHSVERKKMENYLVKIDSFHGHCIQNLKTVHTASVKKISILLKHLTRKGKVETNLQCVAECQGQLNEKLDRLVENYVRVSDLLSSAVKDLLEKPQLVKISDRTKMEPESIKSTGSSVSEKSILIHQLLTQATELQASKLELTTILDTNSRKLQELLSDSESVSQTSMQRDRISIECSETLDSNSGACGHS